MMDVLLLAHEGHEHGPDLGFVALLVAGSVLAVVLLVAIVRQRTGRKVADRWPASRPPSA